MNDILFKLDKAKRYYILAQPKFPRFKRNLHLLYKCANIYYEIALFYININSQIFKKYNLYTLSIYNQILRYKLKHSFKSQIIAKIQNISLQLRYL